MTASDPGVAFRLPVRVYYEDTDAAGVVYYANYLKFLERARSEWLSARGFEVAALAQRHGIALAVRRLALEYLRPARLGDRLDVTFEVTAVHRAWLAARQAILLSDVPLVTAQVTVVCLSQDRWKPSRFPAELLRTMENAA